MYNFSVVILFLHNLHIFDVSSLILTCFLWSVTCLSGWEARGDKCFYFSTDTVPKFADGVAKCKALSPVATLASVASQEELDWVLGESQP
jgi:hypothetical protein